MANRLLLFFLFLCHQAYTQVDFTRVDAQLEIDTIQQSVSGKLTYYFEVLKQVDSLSIDAQNMSFYDVKLDTQKVKHTSTDKKFSLKYPITKGKHVLTFEYHAVPRQTMYFIGWNKKGKSQLWTQGQGKYTSHWFPSFDDVTEKLIFNIEVIFDKKYTVLSNGLLVKKEEVGEKISWTYQMDAPMSSYLLALIAGKFEKQTEHSASGIPLEMYYNTEDKNKVEPTYRYSKQLFDFFEQEIEIAYPWHVYRQIPLHDFIYAGMENTTATTFAHEQMVDEIGFNDQPYVNINAHELAHQWFGNLVTAESSKHHWLQEGFATYYALLAEKEIFGEDYFYWELFKYALELQEASRYDTVPLLNEKASSLTFYKKGAWALHVIRTTIGKENFNKAVFNYLTKHQFKEVHTADFLQEVNLVSTFDIDDFQKRWLEDAVFNAEEVFALLFQSRFIQDYASVQKLREVSFKEKKTFFNEIVTDEKYYFPVKEEIIYQLKEIEYREKKKLIHDLLALKNPKLDLAIALTTTEISAKFRTTFEQLLKSQSYKAREVALFKLWENYPEYTSNYLETTRGIEGLGDKNLELQWLYLSVVNRGYDKIDLGTEVSRLVAYTQPEHEALIREKALGYCLQLRIINYETVTSLIEATTHQRWQFAKYAKGQLRNLLQDKSVKEAVIEMIPDLTAKEKVQIQKIFTDLATTKAQ